MVIFVVVIILVLIGYIFMFMNVFMFFFFINRLRQCICYYLVYGFLEIYDVYVFFRRIEEFFFFENLCGMLNDFREEDVVDNVKRNFMKLWSDLIDYLKKMKEVEKVRDWEKLMILVVLGLMYRKFKWENEFILENIELIVVV